MLFVVVLNIGGVVMMDCSVGVGCVSFVRFGCGCCSVVDVLKVCLSVCVMVSVLWLLWKGLMICRLNGMLVWLMLYGSDSVGCVVSVIM